MNNYKEFSQSEFSSNPYIKFSLRYQEELIQESYHKFEKKRKKSKKLSDLIDEEIKDDLLNKVNSKRLIFGVNVLLLDQYRHDEMSNLILKPLDS